MSSLGGHLHDTYHCRPQQQQQSEDLTVHTTIAHTLLAHMVLFPAFVKFLERALQRAVACDLACQQPQALTNLQTAGLLVM
jgi:hypothetical protein